MRSVPTTSLDLGDPEVVADPYPFFAEERGAHPVAWHEPAGMYLTFDHASVGAVQRDRRLGRLWTRPRARGVPRAVQPAAPQPDDGERAARAHPAAPAGGGGVQPGSRRAAAAAGARALAAELLAEADPAGFDVVGDYAEPLPVLVIAELLGRAARVRADAAGVVAGDRADVRAGRLGRRWSTPRSRRPPSSPGWCASWSPTRRRAPRDDLISDLAATELTEDEMVAAVVLLLNAGHEASVNVFGNGLVAMLERGLAGPGADVALTVEEMLRFDSALQLFERTATEPVEVGRASGRSSRGRRSPRCSARPTATRPCSTRRTSSAWTATPQPHLAFGVGVHFCLGAPLARMELAESLAALFAASRACALAGEPESRGTFVLRGYRSVPVAGAPIGCRAWRDTTPSR